MSKNTIGPMVISFKTGSSSLINKHESAGQTDRQNLAVRLI